MAALAQTNLLLRDPYPSPRTTRSSSSSFSPSSLVPSRHRPLLRCNSSALAPPSDRSKVWSNETPNPNLTFHRARKRKKKRWLSVSPCACSLFSFFLFCLRQLIVCFAIICRPCRMPSTIFCKLSLIRTGVWPRHLTKDPSSKSLWCVYDLSHFCVSFGGFDWFC